MHYYLVCPVGGISGKEDFLTYQSSDVIELGSLVKIPFGKTTKLGVVINTASKPTFTTKPIENVLEKIPFHLIDLSLWISEYYASRLSVVLQSVLPRGLDKKRRLQDKTTKKVTRHNVNSPLTKEQLSAVKQIHNSLHITHLLHGVTGSGKTRIYQELVTTMVKNKKSSLILVPEIALTPQLAAEFESLFKNVLVLHSGLTEAERHLNWLKLRDSKEQWIIIGPRSALFSPLQNLGLIIIDECHEPSFVQDSQPKYSALRVARKLAELNDAKLVLGSATPLISDYFIAQETHVPIIRLKSAVRTKNVAIEVIDIRDRDSFGTHPLFSKKLLESMNKSIVQNEQILLFHNRRGTARMSLCSNCGWIAECKNCHVPMRLHHDLGETRCHICGLKDRLPQTCPECKNPDIDFKGFGSKRIEAEIRKLFPGLEVARFDSDTPVAEQLHNRYQDLYDGKIQILIGTQGLAKGLDLPRLNTVGIVQADSELFIPDYASAERSFQLTTQVIGRAGRTGANAKVFIQTLNPDHPAILYAKAEDYEGFYKYELAERTAEHMPPHTYLLQLTTGYASARSAEAAAIKMKEQIKSAHKSVHVRGPSPAFHEHRGKLFYQQLVVSSSKRSILVEIAKNLPQRWQFTLDPINLL